MKLRNQTARPVLYACFAASALAVAQPVFAQEAGKGLEEVIVTAQRRAEKLENVPMSVAALSSKTLESAGVLNMHDIANAASGVQVDFAGGYTQPAVRGVTTLTTGTGFENNVAIYVDGFYTPDNLTTNVDLANIENVQVLKGPQSTLWGRNATGGAIIVTTAEPAKDHYTGKLEASYGRFDDYSVSGYLSGPVNDRVRFSVAAYNRHSNGYEKRIDINNNFVAYQSVIRQVSVRTKFQVDLSDDLTATLAWNYGLNQDPRGLWYTQWRAKTPAIPDNLRIDKPFYIKSNRQNVELAVMQEGTLKLEWRTGIGKLTSYTGYANRQSRTNFDFDGSLTDLFWSYSKFREDTFQQGIDFNVTAIKNLDLVVGATYYRDFLKNPLGSNQVANFALTGIQYTSLRAEAFAFFADATYHFTDQIALNFGARYAHDDKEGLWRATNPAGVITLGPIAKATSFHAFSPRASIRYEFSPQNNVYASFSRGYRTGGFTPTPPTSAALALPYLPETISAWELGVKSASMQAVRFDLAGFYYKYNNMQVGVTVPDPSCAGQVGCPLRQLTLNGKHSEIYGLDGQVTVQPVDRLNIRFGASWLHARYTDFSNATGTGYNAATGLNVTQLQSWNGQQMSRAPTFAGNLGIDYEFENVAQGSLLLAANMRFTTGYVLNNPSLWGPLAGAALANEQRYRTPGFTTLSGRISWTDVSGHYKITIYGDNLTNKLYLITQNGSAAFGDYHNYAEPISYGIRASYTF
jgi:iron complex outermembrane receptor protein